LRLQADRMHSSQMLRLQADRMHSSQMLRLTFYLSIDIMI